MLNHSIAVSTLAVRMAAPLTVLAVLLPVPLTAQLSPTSTPMNVSTIHVPRFPIAHSPISLVSDVRPNTFLSVTGPKSAWLGSETGPAELWVPPLKVATGFQLSFRIPRYHDPIRGVEVARRVEVRPEMTTITYSHATFTVKEHILAPRGEPGLLVLLEVNTFVPLEIEVRFHPVLQYMWPAAFGGQYSYWDAAHHGYVLSESLGQHNAIIGTSWPAHGLPNPAHRLSDTPSTFVIPIDTARARREFIPIAIAAGTRPLSQVLQTYEGLLANALPLYRESRRWADTVLATTTSIQTPDDSVNLALAWAKIDLERQRVCNPDLGCGFVAGWGTSGGGTRPGFGWFFGGDAAINSLAMDATGQWAPVAEALHFLAKYQRKDGKIPHEISEAAARIPWFTKYPYPYYHADTTPYWMLALWQYWRASGDDVTAKELWPAFKKAWTWCLSDETDGDGIIEEGGKAGMGAIEVGGLGKNLHEDIYLAAVWIEALQGTVDLAHHFHDGKMARKASRMRETALHTLNDRYWLPKRDQHAFALLDGGGTNDNLTAWPGTALAFDLLDPPRAERTLRKLATDSISTDWGARLLSTGSPLYDPLHYNNGAVWPFMTGFVAWGQYRYRRPWSAYDLVDAVEQELFDWSLGRNPENFSGAFYRPMDTTVPDQFFATSMLVTPLLRGALGWEPDAPDHKATLVPQLPPGWDTVHVHHLRVGASTLDVTLIRGLGSMKARVASKGPPVDLTVVLPVPLDATDVVARIDGEAVAGNSVGGPPLAEGTHDQRITLAATQTGAGPMDFDASWKGGLSVGGPTVHLVPGQSSTGVRVVDFTGDTGGWLLELQGEAGRAYDVHLYGVVPTITGVSGAEAQLTPAAGTPRNPHVLHVVFPEGTGWKDASIRLTRHISESP